MNQTCHTPRKSTVLALQIAVERTAFTLIEMLVVITIIALLVSVLLPAVKRSKELARRVECGSQQHQLHIGTIAFAQEHDQRLLSTSLSGWPEGWWRWDGNNPQLVRTSYEDPPFMSYFSWDRDVFYCPANPVGPETGAYYPSHWEKAWGRAGFDGSSGQSVYYNVITYYRLFKIDNLNNEVVAKKATDPPGLGMWADMTSWVELLGWRFSNHPYVAITNGFNVNAGLEPIGRNMVTLGGDTQWAPFKGDEMKYRVKLSNGNGGTYASF